MAEIKAQLKNYIDHVGPTVEKRVRAPYNAPLAESNQKIDTLIAMLQNRDVMIMNILHVPDDNVLEQVGEMSAQFYVPAQADDDRLTYITPDTEVHF